MCNTENLNYISTQKCSENVGLRIKKEVEEKKLNYSLGIALIELEEIDISVVDQLLESKMRFKKV